MDGAICAPLVLNERRPVRMCPFEKRRRRFVVKFYEWYAPLVTCPKCGAQWSEGELLRKPTKKKLELLARKG